MNAALATTVLIVEDERLVAEDLQQSLCEMGYDAFAIASSAEEAIALSVDKCPDVVLMDIRIQGASDGIETAAILKKRFPSILIYLTAHADGSTLDRAKITEPEGYLVKPIKEVDLKGMIDVALYKRDMESSREKLRVAERRLHTIADNVPVSIGYFDRSGLVGFANRLFRSMLPDPDQPLNVAARRFLGEALFKETTPHRERALSGECVGFVVQTGGEGEQRTIEMTYIPDRDAAGMVIGVYALGYDVTQRERLTKTLEHARVELETILNNVPAAITAWDGNAKNRFANKAAQLQYGLSAEQASGRHIRDVIGAQCYRRAQPFIDAALAGEQTCHGETDAKRDTDVRYSQDHYVPEIQGGVITGLYALSFDVTDLRNSHDQIRQLAQRLETVREEERRAVSMILHDGIAQDLFALKLELDHLETNVGRKTDVARVCRGLSASLAKCMDDTRQLANELRPIALGSFGAVTAIKEHARRFGERSNLKITVTASSRFPTLNESTQLLLFRAAQEGLTNVARHAHATAVKVVLRAGRGGVAMSITDDGIGFTEASMHKPRSVGLVGIRERFAALGGGLVIRRRNPGTTMTVYLPRSSFA
jgi:PAS domain S-box-containing protein